MAASEKQVKLAKTLISERDVPAELLAVAEKLMADESVAPKVFSDKVIDPLFSIPRKGGVKPSDQGGSKHYYGGKSKFSKPAPNVADGTYLLDGVVYKVQHSHSTGKPYAKQLNPDAGTFVYAPGAIYTLAEAKLVTIQEAMAYGLTHGFCIHCGHGLEKEDSLTLSIGPVCAMKHHGLTQKQLIEVQKQMQDLPPVHPEPVMAAVGAGDAEDLGARLPF